MRASIAALLGLTLAAPGWSQERLQLASVDPGAALAADAARGGRAAPRRVAVPVPVAADLTSAGAWERRADGGSRWRLTVSSPGARFLSFKFSAFDLPSGATLSILSAGGDWVAGPFTAADRQPDGRLGSPMIPGESALLELDLPPGAGAAELRLESVSHGFREPAGGNFGCQRDINCPEGAPYQADKRAVAEGYDGAFICSGTMLNNVRQDNRHLYLTADHCEFWLDPSTLTFYWNYENSGCGNHNAPLAFSSGATNLYHNATADLHLLELAGAGIDATHNIYYSGWNRGSSPPTRGASISFPDDKPKQIAIESDPLTDCAPAGCPGGFGANYWRVEDWDVGVTEGGSSGAGLLDADHRLVGALTGGVGTDCGDFEWDEYAKISFAWTQLRPFLDPQNTGATSLPGKDHAVFPGAPPAGTLRLAKGAGNVIDVTYDSTTCSGHHAVMLRGAIGNWSGYTGDVGAACNLGDDGSASFTFAGSNAWFNLVWVNAGQEAGHPGYATAGARSWSAAGRCGTTSDDVSDPICD